MIGIRFLYLQLTLSSSGIMDSDFSSYCQLLPGPGVLNKGINGARLVVSSAG